MNDKPFGKAKITYNDGSIYNVNFNLQKKQKKTKTSMKKKD